MTPKELSKTPTMKEFLEIRDMLNLSDRQREVFVLKYSKLWRNIDIAEELGVSQDTIGEDTKDIREKLKAIEKERPGTIDFLK